MPESDYKGQWWGYIYDQMMENNADWVQNNWRFYQINLKGIHGPVLECACGTGIFLLPLLQSGIDMYGFDISPSMLATLRKKAAVQGIKNITDRISIQDLETFHYDEQRFDVILIPTNSFGMLVTQEAQIRALRNIYDHLAPGGKLLLDLRLAGVRDLAEMPEIVEGNWYTWIHPETGLPIRQRLIGRSDFNQQLILDRCFIEYEGQIEEFPMTGRWIFKEEFQLLLRLAGFKHWKCLGDVEGDLLIVGREEAFSYWIVEK
jgi:SAM-dependent methyltransferase